MADEPNLDLERQFRERLRDARQHCKTVHEEFQKDFNFYSGDQWDEEDLAKLAEEERPAITDNQIQKVVHAVSGSEITNRYEPKYIARTMEAESSGGAQGLSETVRYIRQQCDAEHEESGAFRHCVICGMGVTEIYQDYLVNPEGRPVVARINPTEIMWDPGAQRRNLCDARYLIRPKWIAIDEFKAMWPERAEEMGLSVSNSTGDAWDEARLSGKETDRDWMYQGDKKFYDAKKRRVLVYEYQWKERVHAYSFVNPLTQKNEVIPEEEFETRRTVLDQMASQAQESTGLPYQGFEAVRVPQENYRRAFFAGPHMLEEDKAPIKEFTYTFITGFEDLKTEGVTWSGIVRPMRDRQMGWNKMISETIHRYSCSPKGAFGYEPGFFENPQKAMKDINKPNSPIALLPGAKDKFVQFEAKSIPPEAGALLSIFRDVSSPSGLSAEYFVGQAADLKRTAGSAVQSVQRQNIAMLSVIHDNFREYRKVMGRKFLLWIQAGYLTDGQLIRISGPEGINYVPFQKEWAFGEYNIITEEAPTSPNKKKETMEALIQTDLAGTLIESGVINGSMIAELLDLPPHLQEQAKKNAVLQSQVQEANLQLQLLQITAQTQMIQMQMQQAMMPPTAPEAPQENIQ